MKFTHRRSNTEQDTYEAEGMQLTGCYVILGKAMQVVAVIQLEPGDVVFREDTVTDKVVSNKVG